MYEVCLKCGSYESKGKYCNAAAPSKEIITFNNELYEPFNKITERFEKEMKTESLSFNSGDDNRYKKCPNCGRIWFKVKGCNSMKCGNRTKFIFGNWYRNPPLQQCICRLHKTFKHSYS